VPEVVPDRPDESVLFGPVEVLDQDLGFTALNGRAHPMHAVDHPHGRPVHHDGRQIVLCRCENSNVLGVLALHPG
jgi:hypothetical protein